MAVELLTKTAVEVTSYLDSAIFHQGKGLDKDDNPFGILPNVDNPFDLCFDESTLLVTLKPGIFSVYGRQVVIDSDTEILDAKTITQTGTHYCLVVCTVDLDDVTNQTATISILRGTNSYPTISSADKANLYTRRAGRYSVPLRRFIYRTSISPHFIKGDLVPQILPVATRYKVATLRSSDSIGGKKVSALLQNGSFEGKQHPIVQVTADNSEAYQNYKNASNPTSSTPGYSIAEQASKIGGSSFENLLTLTTFRGSSFRASDIENERTSFFNLSGLDNSLKIGVHACFIFDATMPVEVTTTVVVVGPDGIPISSTSTRNDTQEFSGVGYIGGVFDVAELKSGKTYYAYVVAYSDNVDGQINHFEHFQTGAESNRTTSGDQLNTGDMETGTLRTTCIKLGKIEISWNSANNYFTFRYTGDNKPFSANVGSPSSLQIYGEAKERNITQFDWTLNVDAVSIGDQ